ncbi:hypothetical protein [Marinobacter sp. SS21]|uniref:hypothetical protein n=1 Tax=Marinobacter sp. SS21 TaxID=2979460 RepID=UPI00232F07D3|nr:hypothetical protein [Marinobacter sp. SS21]MDC0662799.1 hypothetical protein [Marinobacter sp. SS21]
MKPGQSGHSTVIEKSYILFFFSVPLSLMGWPVISEQTKYLIAWIGFYGYIPFYILTILFLALSKRRILKAYIIFSPATYLIIQPLGRPIHFILNGDLESALMALKPNYGYVLFYGYIYFVLGYLLMGMAWVLWRWFLAGKFSGIR